MSLPGLGLAEPEEQIRPTAATQHQLSEGSEWRFEVAIGSYVKVQVKKESHTHTTWKTTAP